MEKLTKRQRRIRAHRRTKTLLYIVVGALVIKGLFS